MVVRRPALYRDVIIHASFVETVAREMAKRGSFDTSIEILLKRHPKRKDELDKWESLRKMRNMMIHEILKADDLTDEEIRRMIRSMRKILREIYHTKNGLVRKYFLQKYKIDTGKFE